MSNSLASWNYKSFDLMAPNDGIIETGWKMIEDLTTNAYQIQQQLLEEILAQNVHTEYLDKFLNGSSDKKLFKEKVPIINYEDIKTYMEKIANGEPSDILLAEPLLELTLSSGTSGGKNKIMPMTAKELDKRTIIRNTLPWSVINKFADGLEQGKGMYLFFVMPDMRTPSGLRARPSLTSCLKSSYFQKQISSVYTSPYATILCLDINQSVYCQFLCGLLQRDEVLRVGASFANVLGRAIRFLKDYWRELCTNIRTGQLSHWITDPGCRNALSLILNKPNPQLADSIEGTCSKKSWEGIIKELWPRTKFVDVIITGSMAQCIPTLEFYCGGLPLVSSYYAASEGYLGINLEPLSKPSNISYTLLPNMAFYEFIPIKENHQELADQPQHLEGVYDDQDCKETLNKKEEIEPVELVDVKLGQCYEIVVTTFTGLYRYKIGDILMVSGFHNNAPQFRFMKRQGVRLSIDAERTGEDGLWKAVTQALLLIEPLGFILTDYTSYADTCSTPGLYVLFWELKMKGSDDLPEINPKITEECCYIAEESLDYLYRVLRKDNRIGPLEIRVVKHGTFDALMDFFIAKGTSVGQYKTPRCIKSEEALKVMDAGVVGGYFSQKAPKQG
ncbi:PREDICTED: indole-3-acetic acid-amido synthetase GH3.17 [Theobroma cacao]|uniref:Indole-3-acetic acid-amido synthetase GH3.17 n=1 Tax=Theobroma cacao TaxID=3641 RepID=A0AB32WNN0_THECC|nr:PREDICTED: indole-3-acetic acid-amido synthetase GH3.17 [Theobroma cacao]